MAVCNITCSWEILTFSALTYQRFFGVLVNETMDTKSQKITSSIFQKLSHKISSKFQRKIDPFSERKFLTNFMWSREKRRRKKVNGLWRENSLWKSTDNRKKCRKKEKSCKHESEEKTTTTIYKIPQNYQKPTFLAEALLASCQDN